MERFICHIGSNQKYPETGGLVRTAERNCSYTLANENSWKEVMPTATEAGVEKLGCCRCPGPSLASLTAIDGPLRGSWGPLWWFYGMCDSLVPMEKLRIPTAKACSWGLFVCLFLPMSLDLFYDFLCSGTKTFWTFYPHLYMEFGIIWICASEPQLHFFP